MAARRVRTLLGAALLAAALLVASPAAGQVGAQGVDFSALAGQEVTTTVATFASEAPTARFDATIDWGDGTAPSPGSVVLAPSCPYPDASCYEVRGTHTYADPGTYTVETDIAGPDGAAHVQATATVTAPPSPLPGDPTFTPPPGGLTAVVVLADPEVKPGEPAIINASGSTGPIKLFAFDLNGNGTYETQGTSGFASVVHTTRGTKRIGVRVTSVDGSAATAHTDVTVAGTPLGPPTGGALKTGTIVGSMHGSNVPALSEALIKNYNCPTTVQVGVAEATMAPTWTGDQCFERKTKSGLKHPDYPQFVATDSQALLNGLHVVTQGRMVISEGGKWIEVRDGSFPGKADIRLAKPPGYGGAFSPSWDFGRWNVAKPGVVATFPKRLTNDPEFLGLPVITKDTPITFTAGQRSEFQVFVVLPFSEFTLWPANPPTGKPFTVRADNTSGPQIEGSYSYAFDLPLGIFDLTGKVVYSLEGGSDVWAGNFSLQIPDSPVDLDGQIKFRDGDFEYANVHVDFKRPGAGPIGCCIYLVALDGTLTPSAIVAAATFAAGPTLIGDFRAAEATASVKWAFSPFALAFKADQLRIASFPVSATTQVTVTKNMFLAFAFWDDSLGPLSWQLNAEVRIGNPWWVAGGGTACFDVFLEGCAEVYGAAGPKGIGACGAVAGLGGGVRVPWQPANFDDWSSWWGCSFDKVKQQVGAARAAREMRRVRVPPRLRAALFAIKGKGAPPQVELVRPNGTTLARAPGTGATRGAGWLATSDPGNDTTYVAVRRPDVGPWGVRELTGSPAISSIGLARALPVRFARGRVRGSGRVRRFHYELTTVRGTRVTFVERGGDPALGNAERIVDQTIGRAKAGEGVIRLVPAEGKVRRRRIEAVVERDGTTIRTESVARFVAPAFRRPAAPRVKVRRVGNGLVVRWGKVAGAASYQAFLNRSDGATRYLSRPARNRDLRLRPIGGLTSGTVEVRAVSPAGYIGRPGVGRLSPRPPLAIQRRVRIADVLRVGGLGARCTAAADGRCEITAIQAGRTMARGSRRLRYAQTKHVVAKLTAAGRRALARARRSGRAATWTVVSIVPGARTPKLRLILR